MVTGASPNEVSTSKVTGEEERYSHTDLWDFQANVEGAAKIYELLAPTVRTQAPDLATLLDQRLPALLALLGTHTRGQGYQLYPDLKPEEVKALVAAVDGVAEPLAQGKIVPHGREVTVTPASTLKKVALWGGLGLVVVVLGLVAFWFATSRPDREPFYGPHQAGIATAGQKFAFVVAFDVTAKTAEDVRDLLKVWSRAGGVLTQGRPLEPALPSSSPPGTPAKCWGTSRLG